MDYLENTFYISKWEDEQDSLDLINESNILNDIASELTDNCLENIADFYVPNKKGSNAITSLFAIIKKLENIKKETGEDLPVYIIYKNSNYNQVYFFIGSMKLIYKKLKKITEDDQNLLSYQNRYRW